jgi:hypothetical protein
MSRAPLRFTAALVAASLACLAASTARAAPPGCDANGTVAGSSLALIRDLADQLRYTQTLPESPARTDALHGIGVSYRSALRAAPCAEWAPEAALAGAHAFKLAGEIPEAVEILRSFVTDYGSSPRLASLAKSDPARHRQHLGYVQQARRSIASAYLVTFDLARAAHAFVEIAADRDLRAQERRDAAENAALLFTNLGDTERAEAARRSFAALSPPPAALARLDYQVARGPLAAWDERASDEGANKQARLAALAALEQFQRAHRRAPDEHLVRAAYEIARLRRVGGEPAADACREAVRAFGALGTPRAREAVVDLAAECAYRAIDEKIRADFDFDTGHHRYHGLFAQVVKDVDADFEKAERFSEELETINLRFSSRRWALAIKARQASLYDDCRRGVLRLGPPVLRLYTPAEQQLIQLNGLGRLSPQQSAQVNAMVAQRREQYRTFREKTLMMLEASTVKLLAEAVLGAEKIGDRGEVYEKARRRLATLAIEIGDDAIRRHTSHVVDPATGAFFVYRDRMFGPPIGLPLSPAEGGSAPPLPAP